MELPPGVALILASAPRIILPPAIAYCGIQICGSFFDLSVPIWLQLPLYLASFPLSFTRIAYADIRDKRQAAMNGAILAPKVLSKLPGGLDLLLARLRPSKGYLGMCNLAQFRCAIHRRAGEILEKQHKEYGNTVTLRMLWESRACPSLLEFQR